MILWFLPAQDSTHDLCNANQMANKTNLYRKNRPKRSLPPDTYKRENRIDMHCNSRRASFSLYEVTLWHHTCTRKIYDCQQQPGPTGVNLTMILWFLPAQDSTHDLCNANQMANKTNLYRKNRPKRSLPPDTYKRENRIDMHCNSRRASFSLYEVTLWHHTCTRKIYDCQ